MLTELSLIDQFVRNGPDAPGLRLRSSTRSLVNLTRTPFTVHESRPLNLREARVRMRSASQGNRESIKVFRGTGRRPPRHTAHSPATAKRIRMLRGTA
ncbi:hypothetical protein FAIPA1_20351 [Frankia sp. AiPs1]